MDHYEKMYHVLMSIQEDFRKFYEKNNKTAGTRVRKGMLELRSLAHEVRQEVQAIKNLHSGQRFGRSSFFGVGPV